MSPTRRTALLALLAVLGIAVAAAITWGTSQLVSQRIGLSGEPLTAGRRLLPTVTRKRSPGTSSGGRARTGASRLPRSKGATTSTSTTTTSTASPAYTQPSATAPAQPEEPRTSGETSSGAGETTPARERSGGEGDARARGDD